MSVRRRAAILHLLGQFGPEGVVHGVFFGVTKARSPTSPIPAAPSRPRLISGSQFDPRRNSSGLCCLLSEQRPLRLWDWLRDPSVHFRHLRERRPRNRQAPSALTGSAAKEVGVVTTTSDQTTSRPATSIGSPEKRMSLLAKGGRPFAAVHVVYHHLHRHQDSCEEPAH